MKINTKFMYSFDFLLTFVISNIGSTTRQLSKRWIELNSLQNSMLIFWVESKNRERSLEQVEQIKEEYSKKMIKSNVTNAFPSNWVHGMITLTTFW